MSDDWRGENLIRGVKRKPGEGNGMNFRLTAAGTPAKARRRICAHPGCGKALYDSNESGVCRAHNHGPACQCSMPKCVAHRNGTATPSNLAQGGGNVVSGHVTADDCQGHPVNGKTA